MKKRMKMISRGLHLAFTGRPLCMSRRMVARTIRDLIEAEEEVMSGTRWTTVILGLWILLTAFLGLGHQGFLWSDLLTGLVVAGLGVPLARESTWEGWIVGLLGAWMVVAAFLPDLHVASGVYWNNILAGGLITLVGLIPAGESSRRPHPAS